MSRSKFGWSYPPGVTESMLPGNSAAEQKEEALYDHVYILLEMHSVKLPDDALDKLVEAIVKLVSSTWKEGYDSGMADEQIAQEAREKI
jgi:hypothetical protein